MLHHILNIGTDKGDRHSVRMTNLFIVLGLPLLLINVVIQGIEHQITELEFWLINGLIMLAFCATTLFNYLGQNDLAKAWILVLFVVDISIASTRWFGIESLMFFHLIVVYPVAFLLWQDKPVLRRCILAFITLAFFGIFYWPGEPMFPSDIQQKFSAMAMVFINCAILLSIIAKLFSNDTLRAHQELAKQARIDPLTNILNRRELERQLDTQPQELASIAVMLFDIDNFKAINDKYGHLIGDKALKHLVACISKQLPANTLFARFGGDEFCILWPNCQRHAAQHFAQQLVEGVANHPLNLAQGSLTITISLGLAFESQRKDLSRLLIDADDAMYAAKRNGRNRLVSHWSKPKPSTSQ